MKKCFGAFATTAHRRNAKKAVAYLYHLIHVFNPLKLKSTESQGDLEHFFQAHREHGLPVTSQRRAVYEAIAGRDDHPTAEQLFSEVRRHLPQISRMTVHRILGAFVSLGLVAKTCHPGSAARFDPNLEKHHHLVCMDCGRIADVVDSRLNRLPMPKVNPREFQIEDYHVQFQGRCADCRERRKTAKRTRNDIKSNL